MLADRLRSWIASKPTGRQRQNARVAGHVVNLAWFAGSLYCAWIVAPGVGDVAVSVSSQVASAVAASALWLASNVDAAIWWIGAVGGFIGVSYGLEELKVWFRDWSLARIRKSRDAA